MVLFMIPEGCRDAEWSEGVFAHQAWGGQFEVRVSVLGEQKQIAYICRKLLKVPPICFVSRAATCTQVISDCFVLCAEGCHKNGQVVDNPPRGGCIPMWTFVHTG